MTSEANGTNFGIRTLSQSTFGWTLVTPTARISSSSQNPMRTPGGSCAWAIRSTCSGVRVMRLCRGQVVWRDGEVLGAPGRGRFLPCAPPEAARPLGRGVHGFDPASGDMAADN